MNKLYLRRVNRKKNLLIVLYFTLFTICVSSGNFSLVVTSFVFLILGVINIFLQILALCFMPKSLFIENDTLYTSSLFNSKKKVGVIKDVYVEKYKNVDLIKNNEFDFTIVIYQHSVKYKEFFDKFIHPFEILNKGDQKSKIGRGFSIKDIFEILFDFL